MSDDREISHAQRKMWILDRFRPGSTVYTIPLIYHVDGDLDVAALDRALSKVVRRHEVLRTVYRVRAGAVLQVVRPAEAVNVPVVDVSGHADPDAEAHRHADAEGRRPFDLAVGPVIRALLLRTALNRHLLCLTVHHIACDGESLQILEHELSVCYRAAVQREPSGLRPLDEQYADFAAWQASRRIRMRTGQMVEHWRSHLAGLPAPATLPADRERPTILGVIGGHVRFTVEPAVTDRTVTLAKACRATPFAVLLATYAALVRMRGGGADVVIGVPVTSRQRESHYRMIGMFVNMLVHRIDTSGQPTFEELVQRARDESRRAMAHQAVPFDLLVEELKPVRAPGFNPVFQLMLGYQESASKKDTGRGLTLSGCAVRGEFGDTATAKVDLSLTLTRSDTGFSGRLEYNTDLFEAATAREIVEQFRTILAAGTTEPQLRLGGPGLSLGETATGLRDEGCVQALGAVRRNS
ncbi:condensation domain-containing protein [Streptomyces sp. NPDC002742]|uniref:condensation domain-containing protein n=1 Tax=Streptomyces sp. NPDC002742 TaxID=3364663 RepID=UPI0036AE9DC3